MKKHNKTGTPDFLGVPERIYVRNSRGKLAISASQTGIPCFKRAFVMIRITTHRGSRNYQIWDTSNRAINNLKGIFFGNDNFAHMACSIAADWGAPRRREIRFPGKENACMTGHAGIFYYKRMYLNDYYPRRTRS